jgi:ribosomal protein uS4
MKRKHKTYSRPKRPFDKERIDAEAKIKKEFGLKNKKEIWKADAKINSIREKAKKLIPAPIEEQKEFLARLNKKGLKVESIADVLSLDKKDFLQRRLQTLAVKNKLAKTSRHARQLITHRKVLVDGKIVNRPSYSVSIDLENKLSLKKSKAKKVKKEEKVETPVPEEPKQEENKE